MQCLVPYSGNQGYIFNRDNIPVTFFAIEVYGVVSGVLYLVERAWLRSWYVTTYWLLARQSQMTRFCNILNQRYHLTNSLQMLWLPYHLYVISIFSSISQTI